VQVHEMCSSVKTQSAESVRPTKHTKSANTQEHTKVHNKQT